MKLVYDIETDGLLDDVTVIWCIVAIDIADNNKVYAYSDHDNDLPSISEGIELLRSADALIGHNIINYDSAVIRKLTTINLYEEVKHIDTLVMSRVFNYGRTGGHSLKNWGKLLGNDKISYDDWTQYSKSMLEYCIQDVQVNISIYNSLMVEFKAIHAVNPMIVKGLQVEHGIAQINTEIRADGWNFDMEKAIETHKLMQAEMTKIEKVIEPKLGTRKVYKDSEKAVKTPKYKKDGTYSATTCKLLAEYLGHPVNPEDTHLMAPGTTFRRSSIEPISIGQTPLVKDWLLTQGWKPDEYTRKKVNGKWVNQGPKFTSSSLKAFGELGVMIDSYYTLRNRIAVLEGWIKNVEKHGTGRIHGDMFTIGTPSFRCRHSGLVNIPSTNAAWGKEMRELLKADDGDKLVGADSSGNQLRGLVHYVNNDEYREVVVNGDQHQRNADALGCTRPQAKSFLYCYLFGGGDAKLGQCITDKLDGKRGKKAKEDFAKSITGLAEIKDKVESEWRRKEHMQGVGWIHGLDGRPLFIPSEHQCLNYLLQCAEGITCKAATVWFYNKIKEEGLRAKIRIMMHDEMQISCHPDDTARVAELSALSFKEAPKDFGIDCMDGDAIVGTDYSNTH